MKLADILTLPPFKDAKVIAGNLGLTNLVQSVSLLGDITKQSYTKEQLLLTTVASLPYSPSLLERFTDELAKLECTGLVIKNEKQTKDIPQEIIIKANDLAIPVIDLPFTQSLEVVKNETITTILKEQTKELQYAMKIYREFNDIIATGGSFPNVITSLADILQVPVILLDHRLHILTFSHDIDKETFYRIYSSIHETLYQKNIQNELSITYEINNSFKEFWIYPINPISERSGYIIIFGTALPRTFPNTLALEQAANVISLEFMKLYAKEQQERRLKNEFFSNVVDGMIRDEEMVSRGRAYKLNSSIQYITLTCRSDNHTFYKLSTDNERNIHTKQEKIYEALESFLVKPFEESVMFTKGDVFVLFIGVPTYDEAFETKLIDVISELQLEVSFTLDCTLSFGISNYAETVMDLPMSYNEALEALRSGFRENKKSFIQTYRARDLTDMFQSIPNEKLTEFYQSSLKELAFPKDKEKEDLLSTLETYLNHHCQIAETAKSMFIHRNTVIYRIKKCEELLGRPLKSPEETLRLRIALFIKTTILTKKLLTKECI